MCELLLLETYKGTACATWFYRKGGKIFNCKRMELTNFVSIQNECALGSMFVQMTGFIRLGDEILLLNTCLSNTRTIGHLGDGHTEEKN